ncbi:hypothetical protein GX645_00890 [Candidatus Sumerlaeota bacterium]|nr:hypothetical protein [Candidatus Sumerlaeota bacterium]
MRTKYIILLTAMVATSMIMMNACDNKKPAPAQEEQKSSITTHKRTPKKIRARKRNTEMTTTASEQMTTATDTNTSAPEEIAAEKKAKKLAAEIKARATTLTGTIALARVIVEGETTDPVTKAENVLATLPPLPPPTDLNTTLTEDAWKALPTDQAVSQAKARFQKAVDSRKPGQHLDVAETRSTCTYLEGYAKKLQSLKYGSQKGQLSKDDWENLQVFVFDACSDLTEAANIGGSVPVEKVEQLLRRAEGNLKQAEAIARTANR